MDYGAIEKTLGENSAILNALPLPCCFLQYVNKTCKEPRVRLSDKTEVDTAWFILVLERICHQCMA